MQLARQFDRCLVDPDVGTVGEQIEVKVIVTGMTDTQQHPAAKQAGDDGACGRQPASDRPSQPMIRYRRVDIRAPTLNRHRWDCVVHFGASRYAV